MNGPIQAFGLLSMLAVLGCVAWGLAACRHKLASGRDPDPAPSRFQDAIYTVSGTLKGFAPAAGRPGCVLELTDGRGTGLYYVPLSPHDVRTRYPDGSTVRLSLDGTAPTDGVYETVGDGSRAWELG